MKFAYTGRSRSGEQASGSVDADSRVDAIRKLERMGLVPVGIDEAPIPPSTCSPSGTAIASLIMSLLGISLPAVICGHIGLSKIKKSAGSLSGTGLAVAGLIIGYLGLVIQLFFVGFFALGAFTSAHVEHRIEQAGRSATQAGLNSIATAVDLYEIDVGQIPGDIDSLIQNRDRNPRWRGPYLTSTLDPWDRPYELTVKGPSFYQVLCLGADGIGGTKDDVVVESKNGTRRIE